MEKVYIKDMVMPQCCEDCILYISNLMILKKHCMLSGVSEDKSFNPAEKRMSHCRLQIIEQ